MKIEKIKRKVLEKRLGKEVHVFGKGQGNYRYPDGHPVYGEFTGVLNNGVNGVEVKLYETWSNGYNTNTFQERHRCIIDRGRFKGSYTLQNSDVIQFRRRFFKGFGRKYSIDLD